MAGATLGRSCHCRLGHEVAPVASAAWGRRGNRPRLAQEAGTSSPPPGAREVKRGHPHATLCWKRTRTQLTRKDAFAARDLSLRRVRRGPWRDCDPGGLCVRPRPRERGSERCGPRAHHGAARRTRNAESGRPSRADGRGDGAHARAGTPLRLRGKDAPPPATMRMELWGHRQRDQSQKDTPRRGRWQEAAQSPGLGSRGCRQGGRGGAERVVGTELGLWREEVLDTVPATVRGVRRYLSPPSPHPNLGKPIHCAARVSPQGDLSV